MQSSIFLEIVQCTGWASPFPLCSPRQLGHQMHQSPCCLGLRRRRSFFNLVGCIKWLAGYHGNFHIEIINEWQTFSLLRYRWDCRSLDIFCELGAALARWVKSREMLLEQCHWVVPTRFHLCRMQFTSITWVILEILDMLKAIRWMESVTDFVKGRSVARKGSWVYISLPPRPCIPFVPDWVMSSLIGTPSVEHSPSVADKRISETNEKPHSSLASFHEQHCVQCIHSEGLAVWKPFVNFLYDIQ